MHHWRCSVKATKELEAETSGNEKRRLLTEAWKGWDVIY